jgi:hypothetical protein
MVSVQETLFSGYHRLMIIYHDADTDACHFWTTDAPREGSNGQNHSAHYTLASVWHPLRASSQDRLWTIRPGLAAADNEKYGVACGIERRRVPARAMPDVSLDRSGNRGRSVLGWYSHIFPPPVNVSVNATSLQMSVRRAIAPGLCLRSPESISDMARDPSSVVSFGL